MDLHWLEFLLAIPVAVLYSSVQFICSTVTVPAGPALGAGARQGLGHGRQAGTLQPAHSLCDVHVQGWYIYTCPLPTMLLTLQILWKEDVATLISR